MRIAAGISAALHVVVLTALALLPEHIGPVRTPDRTPIVLKLNPDQPRQLVETAVETEAPPEETRNISTVNAAAASVEVREDDAPGPALEDERDLEELAAAPTTEPAPPAPPAPPVPAETPAPAPEAEQAEEATPEPLQEQPQEDVDAQLRVAARQQDPMEELLEPLAPGEAAPSAPPAPEVAPAPQAAAPIEAPPRPARGESGRSMSAEGFTNFPAIQDELAPYLLEIRRKVEREWKTALTLSYSGNRPTEAEIDCAISEDGQLVYARIVGTPSDPSYAAHCRRAIERAAPFDAFPFEVPEMYRDQDLEIRWTFSYLM